MNEMRDASLEEKLATAGARIEELEAAIREREEITRGDVAKIRELLDRIAELEAEIEKLEMLLYD